jgi:3-methyladenine DNA glycosylase AlkD
VVAATIVRELEARADPRVAARAVTFFKDPRAVVAVGVPTAAVRRVVRQALGSTQAWTWRHAVRAGELLVRRAAIEHKAAGVLVVASRAGQAGAALLAAVRRWCLRGWCDNWATVDALCLEVMRRLLERHPALIGRTTPWLGHRNLWLRRVAVVSLVPFARRGMELDRAYDAVWRLRNDREDLIQKAAGWLLREAGRTDPERPRRFLLSRGGQLSRTTVRYSIERFPPPVRRALLGRTRAVKREA